SSSVDNPDHSVSNYIRHCTQRRASVLPIPVAPVRRHPPTKGLRNRYRSNFLPTLYSLPKRRHSAYANFLLFGRVLYLIPIPSPRSRDSSLPRNLGRRQ